MATREAPVHEAVKRRLVEATETETDLIFRTYRNTSRVARNAVSRRVLELERAGRPFEDVGALVAGARGRVVYESGDLDHGIWSAGISQALIRDVPTVAELVDRMVADAAAVIRRRLTSLLKTTALADA
jgi:nitronate monooxygenase